MANQILDDAVEALNMTQENVIVSNRYLLFAESLMR